MTSPPVKTRPGRWIGALLAVSVLGGAVAFWSAGPGRKAPTTLGPEFEYDVERYSRVPPGRLGYDEGPRIETGLDDVRALAVGPGDHVYVAAEGQVLELDREGSRRRLLDLAGTPSCLTVAADATLYVCLTDHVEVLGPSGELRASWPPPEEEARLTSIAAAGAQVYVADARHRTVWRYRSDGELLGQLEAQAVGRGAPGFVVPSPYFDVAVSPDGLLRVVNPGRLRIETYFEDGTLLSAWGTASYEVDGFSGCCNPSHIAVLPDGRLVTSEKGLVRVKVHDPDGNLECVVADVTTLGEDPSPREVAADSTGRVLVLDPTTRSVRTYTPKRQEVASGT